MKKTLLTLAWVLTLGLVANAQSSSNWFDWEIETEDTFFEASNVNLFDWGSFSDLFDMASEVNIIDNWFSKVDLGDRLGSGSIILPDSHGGNTDVDAPLGSGIAVLAGLGAAYAMAKRRKKE